MCPLERPDEERDAGALWWEVPHVRLITSAQPCLTPLLPAFTSPLKSGFCSPNSGQEWSWKSKFRSYISSMVDHRKAAFYSSLSSCCPLPAPFLPLPRPFSFHLCVSFSLTFLSFLKILLELALSTPRHSMVLFQVAVGSASQITRQEEQKFPTLSPIWPLPSHTHWCLD